MFFRESVGVGVTLCVPTALGNRQCMQATMGPDALLSNLTKTQEPSQGATA